MRVIAGLGNPGIRYRFTRHNVGFRVLDALARRYDMQWERKTRKAKVSRGSIKGCEIVLVKPQAYMNRSGEGIAPLMDRLSVGPQDLVVVHDDVDLPFGKIRIRQGGGAGGHKGVLSIMGTIESGDFLRVKMGIGRPEHGIIDEYVLECFSQEEADVLPDVLDHGVKALECILTEGTGQAMNRFNKPSS